MISTLQRSKDNKEIISIWQYNGDKSSIVGYVSEISDDYIGFRHFTRFGKPDGIIFIKIDNIKSIDFNDDYTKVMECLIHYADIIDNPIARNCIPCPQNKKIPIERLGFFYI
ncbi:hypothetical protein [uncultured Flavobacterium sp.]|uniref:hypothetical protein n=1 Tax=uncultured Flavobacterium sp. TaxID=165435 RepID=UPI00261F8A7A|nr:hypothetical protein [uncultured Flavobacterium sp.]